MTVREIEHHLASMIGVELSPGTISAIAEAVAEAVLEWQQRPLEEFYPVIYLDAIRIKVRQDHRGVGRSAYIAVGLHRRRRRPRGHQARPGDLGPGHRGGVVLGARVR